MILEKSENINWKEESPAYKVLQTPKIANGNQKPKATSSLQRPTNTKWYKTLGNWV